ncbi:GTP-binding protein 8 [Hondaea fermentalgiana]|uniref:GTP-binding protein 8 n=1 Tax=Hondaea fermentalgiana TaxID=2315210 RepID=A0A2R5GIP4_9STRA|nr:GTP-binding protein 8 [Hondaea fermentalgiana]|eukprot:GBG30762.1 GTP-binding protein 8 [Hondaea fermentalgiana]
MLGAARAAARRRPGGTGLEALFAGAARNASSRAGPGVAGGGGGGGGGAGWRADAARKAKTVAKAKAKARTRGKKKRQGLEPPPPPPPKMLSKEVVRTVRAEARKTKKQLQLQQQKQQQQQQQATTKGAREEDKLVWKNLVNVVRNEEGLETRRHAAFTESTPSHVNGGAHSQGNAFGHEVDDDDMDLLHHYHMQSSGSSGNIHEAGTWAWTIPGFGEPYKPSTQTKSEARKLFRNGFNYLGAGRRAEHIGKLIDGRAPEIAVLGRSNVGKSSLMNALLGVQKSNSKDGALVSNKQGRTRQVHAWGLGRNQDWSSNISLPAYRLVLTDLPGYGYAALDHKGLKDLSRTIFDYLTERDRSRLVHAIVLADARIGVTDHDENMMRMLDTIGLTYTLVFTKCDRLNEAELETRLNQLFQWLEEHPHSSIFPRILGFTSKPHLLKASLGDTYPSMSQDGNLTRLREELLMHADAAFYARQTSTTHHR